MKLINKVLHARKRGCAGGHLCLRHQKSNHPPTWAHTHSLIHTYCRQAPHSTPILSPPLLSCYLISLISCLTW